MSVVIPLYNKRATVREAVASVLRQSFRDFECIVVDDGSSDGGANVVRQFDDPRLRLFAQANSGVSAARNAGIELAAGDLVAFLDADDRWDEDFLETIIDLRQKFPFCDVFATSYRVASELGSERPALLPRLNASFREGVIADYFRVAQRSEPPVWTSAVAVTRTALRAVGGFPVGIASGEDLLTWARLVARYDLAFTRAPKAVFNAPYDVASRPGRRPATDDVVGRELRRIICTAPSQRTRGARGYVAHWHTMRAVLYLQLAERQRAVREALAAISVWPFSIKPWLLLPALALPGRTPMKVFCWARARRS